MDIITRAKRVSQASKTCFPSKQNVFHSLPTIHKFSVVCKETYIFNWKTISFKYKTQLFQIQNNFLQVRNSTLSSTKQYPSSMKQFYNCEKLSREFWHDLTAVMWLLVRFYRCHVTFGSNFLLCRSVSKGKIICTQMPIIRTPQQQVAPGSRLQGESAFQAAQPKPPCKLFYFYCKLLFEVS